MSLDESLQGLMGEESVSALSEKTGASKDEVSIVLSQAVPALLKSTQDKAESREDGSGMEDVFSNLGNLNTDGGISGLLNSIDFSQTSSLLESLFGGASNSVIGKIAKATGVDSRKVENIINSVAPALLSLLSGEMRSSGGTSISSLISRSGFDLNGAAAMLLGDSDGDGKPDVMGFLNKFLKI